MSENEPVLPVTSPADLRKTGHVLLVGQSDMLSNILVALWKNHRRKVEIGLFDFTPEQHLSKTSDTLDEDNTITCIEYHVTSVEVAEDALEDLESAFDYRKKTPSASGTWILLIDGLAPENWELFKDYLEDGKQARMYVIATTRQAVPGEPLYDAFDTVISGPPN